MPLNHPDDDISSDDESIGSVSTTESKKDPRETMIECHKSYGIVERKSLDGSYVAKVNPQMTKGAATAITGMLNHVPSEQRTSHPKTLETCKQIAKIASQHGSKKVCHFANEATREKVEDNKAIPLYVAHQPVKKKSEFNEALGHLQEFLDEDEDNDMSALEYLRPVQMSFDLAVDGRRERRRTKEEKRKAALISEMFHGKRRASKKKKVARSGSPKAAATRPTTSPKPTIQNAADDDAEEDKVDLTSKDDLDAEIAKTAAAVQAKVLAVKQAQAAIKKQKELEEKHKELQEQLKQATAQLAAQQQQTAASDPPQTPQRPVALNPVTLEKSQRVHSEGSGSDDEEEDNKSTQEQDVVDDPNAKEKADLKAIIRNLEHQITHGKDKDGRTPLSNNKKKKVLSALKKSKERLAELEGGEKNGA